MDIDYTSKAKTMPSPRKSFGKWMLGLLLLSVCGCFSTLILGTAYFMYGELRTSIPDELLPTAEYLYENPIPAPNYLSVSNVSTGRVCYGAAPSDNYTFLYTDVYVNGMRAHKGAHLWNLGADDPHLNGSRGRAVDFNELCLYTGTKEGNLKPGLHLLGVQLKKTPWDNSYPIYEWAVRVNVNSTSE